MRLLICDRCGKTIDDEMRRLTIAHEPIEFAGGQVRLDLAGDRGDILRDFCLGCCIAIYEHFTDTLGGQRP